MLPFIKRKQSTRSKHNRSRETLTLNQFFDEHYFPHIDAIKRQPHQDWSVYNSHIRRQLGHYLLTDLTNPDLDVWVREQMLDGLQRSTINKHIHMFNRMLNIARHWTLLPLQSEHLHNIKKLALGDHTQRFLNKEEIDCLIAASRTTRHPYFYNIVRLFLLTGARHGELRLVKWQDINLIKREWTVPRSKTGRARRIILSKAAVNAFISVRETAEHLMLPTNPSDYAIINPITRTAYHSFYATWFQVRKAANLDDLRIHDLRHAFASVLINKGVSIYEVQTLLGHSTIQMTQRYAHLAPDRLQNRTEIVGNLIESI